MARVHLVGTGSYGTDFVGTGCVGTGSVGTDCVGKGSVGTGSHGAAFGSTAEAIRAWVDGWVVSRGAAEPVAQPWGLTVDVGLPHHSTRHVLTHADEATVRKLAEAYAAPGVSLKIFLTPETVTSWLGPEWKPDGPGWLMTTTLSPTEPAERREGFVPPEGYAPPEGGVPPEGYAPSEGYAPPEGYALRSWERGGVTRLLVVAPDGGFAARGQVAPTGRTAVVDQVETAPAHRRRGLGALVMRTLQHVAYEQGARLGILGATTEGRALYESLNWQVHAPLVGVTHSTGVSHSTH